jgi:hypothetical protein
VNLYEFSSNKGPDMLDLLGLSSVEDTCKAVKAMLDGICERRKSLDAAMNIAMTQIQDAAKERDDLLHSDEYEKFEGLLADIAWAEAKAGMWTTAGLATAGWGNWLAALSTAVSLGGGIDSLTDLQAAKAKVYEDNKDMLDKIKTLSDNIDSLQKNVIPQIAQLIKENQFQQDQYWNMWNSAKCKDCGVGTPCSKST